MSPTDGCPKVGLAYPEVTQVICRVPSTSFSQAPWYSQPVHQCRFGVRSICWGYFPGVPGCPINPVRSNSFRPPSHSNRCRNINLLSIDYAFRPHLRGRLTLRGLTLRRNPWTCGESVSHTLCRYSCQHSHFRYLQQTLRSTFTGLRNAPLPLARSEDPTNPQLRCMA